MRILLILLLTGLAFSLTIAGPSALIAEESEVKKSPVEVPADGGVSLEMQLVPPPELRISAGIDEILPPESCLGEPPLLEMHSEIAPLVPLDSLTAGSIELTDADAERARLDDEWFPIDEYWDRVTQGLDEWTRKVGLGGRYLTGNSNELFVDVAVDFERRQATKLTQINLGGQFGEANGARATNRWFANSNTDYDTSDKRWLFYTQVRDRYDQFERLSYRGTLSTGFGYRFFDQPDRRFITRLGPAVTYELYYSPNLQRLTPDAFCEIEARWPVKKRITAEHKSTLNPSLLDIQLLRVTSSSGISWALDEAEAWCLKLGFLWIYNGRPNAGLLPSDYTGTMSVVYLKK